MVVKPLKVLLPLSVAVPAASLVKVPLPLIALPTESEPVRLKTSAPLFVTLPPVPSWPVAPPVPTCSVPALIKVVLL